MSRMVLLTCCLALANARTLVTDDASATAVSYSSIRFGTPTSDQKTATDRFDPFSTNERINQNKFDENPTFQKILDSSQSEATSSNAQTASTYTEAIFPGYVPSGSRVLNLARPIPASRNIPQSPSPKFDSVPSVLKTEGLSAYASFSIQDSTGTAKGSTSSVMIPSKQTITYSEPSVVSEYDSVPAVQQSEGISYFTPVSDQAQASQVSYSESPIVSHVSVSSAGTNYSW